jgi:glycosyltransferase 2 family protein
VKRMASSVGLVVGILGLAFVGRALVQDREAILAAIANASVTLLLLAVVVAGTGMVQIGLGWRRSLEIVGQKRPRLDTLFRYFVGQLGKYVPGGIWPVVGRAEMARRAGIVGRIAYSSTILSLGTTYLAAVLLGVATLPFSAGADQRAFAIFLLLPVGIGVLHPRVLSKVQVTLEHLSKREFGVPIPSWSVSIRLLLRHVPAWLSIGTATWLVAYALGDAGSLGNVLFATSVSWFVGFVAIPVPGGIGVREAVFLATATSLSPGIAATTALLARFVFITVDLGGSAITSALAGPNAHRAPHTDSSAEAAE